MECHLKNISIHYEVRGEGKPLLLLHGYSVDHRLMLGCMEPLFKAKAGYKRIYIDLPGMGKTRGESWIKNSDHMLDSVIAFIEEIIPDESFLLAGESYGGYLARGLVYKMANRIDGLFLLCPAVIMDFKKRRIPEHQVLMKDELLLSELEPWDAEDFASMHVVQSRKVWERYRDEIATGIQIADNDFLKNLQEKGYAFSFDVDKLEERYNKPTLMLLGRQDSIVGYKDAWDILDNYSRATFAVLDKAGHNLQIEQEGLLNSLVDEWLERVKANKG